MQDLEPELQEAWGDAGWSWESEGVPEEAVNGNSREADLLLAELMQQIEEATLELQHATGQEEMPSNGIDDIWLLAGWKLPESCVGIPFYDYDATDAEEHEIDSPKFSRQVSQSYQYDPTETLREVAQGGSMLRQVSSTGDKYVNTEQSSPMLCQISRTRKQRVTDGAAIKLQVVCPGMKRQMSEGTATHRRDCLCSHECDTVESLKTTVVISELKRQLSEGSGIKRQESIHTQEGGSPTRRERVVSFSDGCVESPTPTQQLSPCNIDDKKGLPIQGSLALTVSVAAIAAGVFLRESQAVPAPCLDYAIAKVLEAARGECTLQHQLTCFHARGAPSISVLEYIARMRKYLQCSDESLILSLVYINRLTTLTPPIEVGQRSCHRLLLTSLLVSMKYYDDVFPSNTYSSCVFGISLSELNSLEAEFVKLLDWQLFVKTWEYSWFLENLSQIRRGYVPN